VPADPGAPCIIGVARRTWRRAAAPEPLDLWEELARAAAADAGSPGAVQDLQSLQVVYCQSWEYDDAPRRLADRLGAEPAHRVYSGIGGSVPLRLAATAAGALSRGEADLALIVGGEALATRKRLADPPWSFAPREAAPFPITLDPHEAANGIFQAYLTFALLDTARRGALGRTPAEHREELGRLLAPMTDVAAAHPEHAWFPIARSAAELTTPGADNRMVATPYTKLMTAIMDVDMAAAVLVATEERADRLGVPRDRRVYLRGLGFGEEPPAMAARPELGRSPALRAAGRSALGAVDIDDVAHLDLYSCFASSLAFARDALGVTDDRALTVTGGLPYHGGPGSDYCTHALAAMTDTLREDAGSLGLVTGIGMHMTHHAAALLSTEPGPFAPPAEPAALPEVGVVGGVEGTGTVVTHSTNYTREGPSWTALICDLPDGTRCYARLAEPPGEDEDLVGTTVTLAPGKRGSTTATR
jgi:acetyl-CoA C-acetyltransferase